MFSAAAKNSLARCVDHLLPASCVFCGEVVASGYVCRGCYDDLPWIVHACERCGTPLVAALPAGIFCGVCQQRPPPFELTQAPLHYEFPIDTAIKALKFRRQVTLAPALASLVEKQVFHRSNDFDALVPVPLYRWRQAIRGFNQAQELARYFHRSSGLPILHCVKRVRRTEPQSGLDAARRRHNMKGAFSVTAPLQCNHALIVDDVMTTGETCRSLAATLLAAGVKRVSVLTIARASS